MFLIREPRLYVDGIVEELHKGTKRPHCNPDFMNNIEVRYNIG